MNKSKSIQILEKQLDSILINDKDEGIAISLKGSWGIGKTFFWDNYVNRKFQGDKNVYISLFGKNSLDDIKKAIVLKLYDRNKILGFISKTAGSTKFAGIDIASISNNITKKDFTNIVICFDDFERISKNLDMGEVLGYISELKEQKKCKIIIINNNNLLEKQDRLNNKIISKIKKDEIIQKYTISDTNNDSIFKSFTEKIIDYNLEYEPSIKDNFELVSDELKIFNKSVILQLLENIPDENKKFNIRYMKRLIDKLNLLKFIDYKKFNIDILNSILVNIFLKVYNLDYKNLQLNFTIKDITPLKKYINFIIEKHYIDKKDFIYSLNLLNNKFSLQDTENSTSTEIKNIYNKYLYDLQYKEIDFVHNLHEIIEDNKNIIIKLVSIDTFKLYINRLQEIDKTNDDIYKLLFINSMKYYIDDLFISDKEIPCFLKDEYSRIFEENSELEEYFNNKILNKKSKIVENKNEIIKLLKQLKEKNGWNPEIEATLGSISIEQHEVWIIEDNNYYESTFKFIIWINSFSGNKPFSTTYRNIIEAYLKLLEINEYKNRFVIMFKYLGFDSYRELEIIKAIKRNSIGHLTHSFIVSLQNNGVNSGIIDKLMAYNKKYDFIYELYKILDESSNSGPYQEDRQNTIKEFNKKIKFKLNFKDDYKIVHNIFNKFKQYNEIFQVDI